MWADFDNDGSADLAVGVPVENENAGAVNVLYGTGGGLTGAGGQLFTQVAGNPEAGDSFGWELAAGDFDSDGFADLAAGAPFEAVGSAEGAGAVSVLYGSAGGLTRTGGSCSPRSAGRSRPAMSSAPNWPTGTSTTTAPPIWPPPRRPRMSDLSSTPAWSACSMAPEEG